jgi:Ca2+-binding RTX toxin-like protein
VKSAANKYQLPALLLNKSINLKYKGKAEMAIINGTEFNDNGIDKKKLVGTNASDSIYGKAGNDILSGLGSNDKLYGERGHDKLYGGTGNDQLYGGTGNDQLYGGTGNDQLYGGIGKDKLYGSIGNDYLNGDAGNDTLSGDAGNDDLNGDAGNDSLIGGSGNDELNGFWKGTEFDTLTGGADADKFVLGAEGHYNFYTGLGFALITDFKSSEGDKIALFETLDKYTLEPGNFGYGNPNVQDTKIWFGNDQIGVLQDITNLKATDFIKGDPFPQ